jgi:hypothetical protein
LTIAVSFTESVKPHLTVLHPDYSERGEFLLESGGNFLAGAACMKGLESVLIARCRGISG